VKLDWRGWLGIALSALLLWVTLRGLDLAAVWSHVRRANLPLLALSVVTATAIFLLRARRWRPILHDVAPELPLVVLFRPIAIGVMVTNLVPVRLGELARAFAITRETSRVSFAAALASVAVDRVFDAVVVVVLLLLAMGDPAFAPGTRVAGIPVVALARGGAVLALVGLAGLGAMVFLPALVLRVFDAAAGRVVPRFAGAGHRLLVAFIDGLRVLRSPRRFASVLAWTFAHWLLYALALWLGFRAFDIRVPFTAALFVNGVLAMGAAIPQAPGFWGAFEAIGKASLAVYHVPGEVAVAWAGAFHLLTWIPITVIGLVYFGRLGMHFGELRRAESAPAAAPPPAPAGR
jgi:uncharacterized protein (TIRG00374 family)